MPCVLCRNILMCFKGGKTMKELKKESGVTQISFSNIALLVARHGPVRFMLHYAVINETANHATLIAFKDGYLHRATGFSSGNTGQASHGLRAAIRTWLERRDITIFHISRWNNSRYLLLPGKGCGTAVVQPRWAHRDLVSGSERGKALTCKGWGLFFV